MEELTKCKSHTVQLEPFMHQVGGHSSMLCLDEGTVCKPLVARELRFYQTLPENVRRFTPAFYGIIQVRIEQEDAGYVRLVATPPEFYRPKTVAPTSLSRIRLRRSGSIEIESDSKGIFKEPEEDEEEENAVHQTSRRQSSPHNPWVLRCHRDNLLNFISSEGKSHLQNFILLENLTARFTLPCVLDLKMGTRQYSDLATAAKRRSKMLKEASTTSGRLGVRLCGMQVYQVTSKHYLCRNKFYGRGLTVGGFERTLRQFLHNGSRIRADILPPLIRQLEELAAILDQQEAFRFYTSSLLLLYDGECSDSRRNSTNKINAFGDVANKNTACADSTNKLNNGECSGREGVKPNGFSNKRSLDTMGRSASADAMSYVARRGAVVERSHSLEPSNCEDDEEEGEEEGEPPVDVRIIDFAHSTHKGLGDPIQYTGSDQGFLFGIENLISLLKNIQSTN